MYAPETILERAKHGARRILITAGIFSFFVNILMLTGPIYMLQIYDRVLSSRSYETLLVITLLTLGLFAAMAILDLSRSALLARAGEKFESDLKDATFDVSMDVAHHDSSNASQPLRDLRLIRQFIGSPALTAVFDAPWSPIFIFIVFLMHWLLGLVAITGLCILVALSLFNERMSRNANKTAQGLMLTADKVAQSAFRSSTAADAMGMRPQLKGRWRAYSDRANYSALTATDRVGGLTAVSKATRLFLQSAILGTGAYLAINGAVSPGVMIAASIITGRALAPVEIITSQWRNFAITASAYQRFAKIAGTFEPQTSRTARPTLEREISVERLVCRPGSAKNPVLKNITFELAAGELLGVIGPSAAGKSTLAKALVGVEPPIAGEIRFDGVLLGQWDQTFAGDMFGYLPQEVELFAGTAAQNIARFQNNAASDDIIAAARTAGAHEMILEFEDGYETDIGEFGAHLSAGQRQRLGLARALFGDPSFVVLDEPNANLDGEGENALSLAIQALKARRSTVLIVAHRHSALTHVDKLLLLNDGELKAIGPRDAILRELRAGNVTPLNRPTEKANGV